MPYEIERQIIDLPIDRIRINPRNKRVHDDFDPHGRDSWLVEDIREHGVLDPVMLFPNGMLDDGHRRLFSVKYLKRATIPAIVLKATDEAAAFHSAQLGHSRALYPCAKSGTALVAHASVVVTAKERRSMGCVGRLGACGTPVPLERVAVIRVGE